MRGNFLRTKFISFVFSLILIFSIYMPAFSYDGLGAVTITGGIVDENGNTREKESTFDEKRTIAGLASKDTKIIITVYRLIENEIENETDIENALNQLGGREIANNDDDELNTKNEREILDVYEITVGFSEMFSQTVDLYLGDNYIEITAVSNDETFESTCVITRKPSNIKTELQNSNILPWQVVPGKSK